MKTYRADFNKNLSLAWPMMLAQLGQVTVNFIDNIMVGKLGAEELAAVSLSVAVYISFVVAGMGLSFALPTLVASADGAGETRSISQYFKHSLFINIVYAVICALLIEIIIVYVLPHLGQEPMVVELAIPYLRLSAWTMIPLMLFQTLRCYSDGMSETKPAMIAILLGNVLNIIFNYMLIFGKWGAPALGVTGAALGSLLARLLMIIIFIMVLYKWKNLWSHLTSAKYFTYQKQLFARVLRLGIPTGLQMFFEVSAFGAASMIMGTLGAKPQAAHQIAINLASITFLICTGMGMAATIRIGNQKGLNNPLGMRQAGISAILQVTLFMILAAIIFVLFRNQLPHIYIADQEVISIAATLLLLAALFQVSDGIQVVALGALRGLQDVLIPSVITFIAYWVIGLPTSYLGAKYFNLGPSGVWLGLVFGLTVSAALLTFRFLNRTRIS